MKSNKGESPRHDGDEKEERVVAPEDAARIQRALDSAASETTAQGMKYGTFLKALMSGATFQAGKEIVKEAVKGLG